jgi:hypothetical protein
MVPAEKIERWVRRLGYLGLALIILFIIAWIVWFIRGIARKALEQREHPAGEEAAMVGTGIAQAA